MAINKYLLQIFAVMFVSVSFNAVAQNSWQQKANFGGGKREAACAFSIGDTGYVMTGFNGDSDYCDVWAWRQDSNIWMKKDSFPGGIRMGASAVSLNGYGYILGGERPSNCYRVGGSVCGGTFYSDLWQYSPATDTWTQLPSCPGGGRNNAVAVADPLDSTIYYGTGNDNDSTYLSDWWAYNVNTANWIQLSSFPKQRGNATGFFVNGNVYLATGDNNDKKEDATSDVWKYDVANDTWVQVASLPGDVRREASAFVIGNKAYICIGVRSNSITLNDLWMYDPVADTWSARANYPDGPGYDAIGFSIGDKGYIGTGTISVRDTFSFWEYTPYAQDTVTGGNQLKIKDSELKIYPNPSNGIMQCSYSGLAVNSRLIITDVLGNTVDTRYINNAQGTITLDESSLSNGIYFYRLRNANKLMAKGKIIISR